MITRKEKIKNICKKLYMIWYKNPSLGLGALITILYGRAGKGTKEIIDIRDYDFEKELDLEIENARNKI